jgi:putative transposase
MKDIKLASTVFIKEKMLFPHFEGWQEGYGAFTYSNREKDILINYIINQEEHHAKKSYLDEYRQLLADHEIEFDEKYLL